VDDEVSRCRGGNGGGSSTTRRRDGGDDEVIGEWGWRLLSVGVYLDADDNDEAKVESTMTQ